MHTTDVERHDAEEAVLRADSPGADSTRIRSRSSSVDREAAPHAFPTEEEPSVPPEVAARMPKGIQLSGITDSEYNAASGRMPIKGMPTKTVTEALHHMREIAMLSVAERDLMRREGERKKAVREKLAKAEALWMTDLLPNFEARRGNPRLRSAFFEGVPASVRPIVWKMAVGNRRNVTVAQYEACLAEATKELPNISFSDDVASTPAAAFSADLPKRRLPSHRRPSEGVENRRPTPPPLAPDARTALQVAARRQIDVDLCRTHILIQSPPPDTATIAVSPPLHPASGGDVDDDFFECFSEDGQWGTEGIESSALAGTVAAALEPDPFVDGVSKLLRAFVHLQPETGYVQGMSYLAGMLLYELPPYDAFVALANLLASGHFAFFYNVNARAMSTYANVFNQTLQAADAALSKALMIAGATPELYVVEWWMTLFSRSLPIDVARRCWDMYLGDEGMLIRISVAIVVTLKDELLANIDDALITLTTLSRRRVPTDWTSMLKLAVSNKPLPSLQWINQITKVHLQPWSYSTTL